VGPRAVQVHDKSILEIILEFECGIVKGVCEGVWILVDSGVV